MAYLPDDHLTKRTVCFINFRLKLKFEKIEKSSFY